MGNLQLQPETLPDVVLVFQADSLILLHRTAPNSDEIRKDALDLLPPACFRLRPGFLADRRRTPEWQRSGEILDGVQLAGNGYVIRHVDCGQVAASRRNFFPDTQVHRVIHGRQVHIRDFQGLIRRDRVGKQLEALIGEP